MMIYIIIGFLALSIVFYCLFGGADFGAGILGIFIERTDGQTISDVIGPVWEANHVWLILAVVILFTGFPRIYATISLYLHIPILMLLIGIILRGTAFAYMHYDAIKGSSTKVYHGVFNWASLITPFFLGTTVGALIKGGINPTADTFYGAFLAPWLNAFSFSVGLFCICLFTFLAAIFMIGEVDSSVVRRNFIRAAKISQGSIVATGALVFGCAWMYDVILINLFLSSPVALLCVFAATCSLGGMWYCINQEMAWTSRFIAGVQVSLILFAWFWVQHPVVIKIQGGADVTFFNAAAPSSTLWQLLIALIAGTLIILPGLFILFRTFKTKLNSSFSK